MVGGKGSGEGQILSKVGGTSEESGSETVGGLSHGGNEQPGRKGKHDGLKHSKNAKKNLSV